MRDLKGRLVVITGGARGIGRATAARFLAEGARVALADVDLSEAEATARALAPIGTASAHHLDVTDGAAFGALVEELEHERGAIDVLVNNAGIMSIGDFVGHDEALERRQLEINLFGVVNGMRAVVPRMRARRRGHVVNVASLAGRVGIPRAVAYTASKFAVVGATEALRNELLGSGIDFTYVLPYLVRTELTAGAEALRWPRAVTAEEVAEALVRAVKRRQVEVYVPRVTALVSVLPAVLPRPLVDLAGRILGLPALFSTVDAEARAPYLTRVTGAPPSPTPAAEAPRTPHPRLRVLR